MRVVATLSGNERDVERSIDGQTYQANVRRLGARGGSLYGHETARIFVSVQLTVVFENTSILYECIWNQRW